MEQVKDGLSPEAGMAVDELYLEMMMGGYECRAPDPEVGRLDAAVFKRGRCGRCGEGREGELKEGVLTFHPFFKERPRSYRCFVICGKCGYTREV